MADFWFSYLLNKCMENHDSTCPRIIISVSTFSQKERFQIKFLKKSSHAQNDKSSNFSLSFHPNFTKFWGSTTAYNRSNNYQKEFLKKVAKCPNTVPGYFLYGRVSTGLRKTYRKFQNLEEQIPSLVSNIVTICFEAFQKRHPDEQLTFLVYEAHYSPILQLEASNPASALPLNHLHNIKQRFRQVLKRIIAEHPERQRFDFTEQHYAMIAQDFIYGYLYDRYLFDVRSFPF